MKQIKEIMKRIYKFVVKFIFFIIYGKISYNQNNDTLLYSKILKNKVIKKNAKDNYRIYEIENGRICTDGVEQVAYITGNEIIDKISYTQIKGNLMKSKYNFVVERGTPYLLKKFNGNVVSLAQGASGNTNYFHWLFDILPRLKIYFFFYDLKNIDYFYLPKLQKFQKKILEILGLKKIKIIDSSKYKHIQAQKIIVSEHPWYNEGKLSNHVNKIPTWIIKWLRKTFIHKGQKFKIKKKIFIDRTESKFKHCQLENNEEVKFFLKNKGFDIVKVGQLSFKKQIFLFKNSKIIVGAHGAAFANLIFCKPNTKVIEIKPMNHRHNNYKKISKVNNLKYKLIPATNILKHKRKNGDIYIKISDLKKALS